MTVSKAKNIEKFLCLLPFISTTIIIVITYINFAKRKAGFKKWILFFFTVAVGIFIAAIVESFLMSGKFIILNWLVSALIMTAVNFVLIEMQIDVDNAPEKQAILPAKSKNIIIIVTAVILTVVFLICFIPKLIEIIKFESEIPDLNGPDNYSLATLTESDILEDYGSRMLMTGSSKQGEKTNVKGIYEDDDRDEVSSHAKIFDGVYTAQATKISGDALTFNISSVVKSGNFAIYILIDGEIYCQADINCNTEISLDNIKNKIVLVKIVGEGADFEFKIKRIIS